MSQGRFYSIYSSSSSPRYYMKSHRTVQEFFIFHNGNNTKLRRRRRRLFRYYHSRRGIAVAFQCAILSPHFVVFGRSVGVTRLVVPYSQKLQVDRLIFISYFSTSLCALKSVGGLPQKRERRQKAINIFLPIRRIKTRRACGKTSKLI